MTANEFVKIYSPYAFEVEKEKGVPAIAILAQAALESGWGNKAIGNNFFGIKYNPEVNDKFQRVLTTEYFADRKDFENKGYEIENVEYHLGINKFKVLIYAKFADYDTPKEAFLAHANLLLSKRYVHALSKKENAKEYLKLIAESGYATDPNYAKKMSDMVDSIIKRLQK
jgi:flagellum-specific peptidoglycan hydrolase FlgJ